MFGKVLLCGRSCGGIGRLCEARRLLATRWTPAGSWVRPKLFESRLCVPCRAAIVIGLGDAIKIFSVDVTGINKSVFRGRTKGEARKFAEPLVVTVHSGRRKNRATGPTCGRNCLLREVGSSNAKRVGFVCRDGDGQTARNQLPATIAMAR